MPEEIEQEVMPTEAENQSDDPSDGQEVGQDDATPNIAFDDDEPQVEPEPAEEKIEDDKSKIEAAFQKKINKQVRKKHEERRLRKDLETRLSQMEAKMNGLNDQKNVTIPPVPDGLDPDFESKIAAREKAIKEASFLEARQNFELERKRSVEEKAQLERQAKTDESIEKMYQGATKYGISKEELTEAENHVAMLLPKNEAGARVAMHIMDHAQSPLIVKHLAENLAECEKIAGMDPVSAVLHIERSIVPEAKKLKPKLTKTPNPAKAPKAKGAPQAQDQFLEGVVME